MISKNVGCFTTITFFEKKSVSFQQRVYVTCHCLLKNSIRFKQIAVVTVKRNSYIMQFLTISEDRAVILIKKV